MLDKLLRYIGIGALLIFGGLFIFTLLFQIPPFKYWITGSALYQALAFLFASVVGVMSLKPASRWRSICLMGLAVVLTGFAWWQAAEQSRENEDTKQKITELRERGLGRIDLVGEAMGLITEDGWRVLQRIHISGSTAQTGVVLRFYGPKVKELIVLKKTMQRSDDEPYEDGREAYAHYIRQPIGIYDLEIKVSEKKQIQFTYKFEDGRAESNRITFVVKE